MWMCSSGSSTAHKHICWSTQYAEYATATRTYKQHLKVCNNNSVRGCIALRPLLSNIWPHTCCPGTILQLRHMANILYVNKQKLTYTHTNEACTLMCLGVWKQICPVSLYNLRFVSPDLWLARRETHTHTHTHTRTHAHTHTHTHTGGQTHLQLCTPHTPVIMLPRGLMGASWTRSASTC